MVSLLLTLNNFTLYFSASIADFKYFITLSLYSKSKDEQMLYLTSLKTAADFFNV